MTLYTNGLPFSLNDKVERPEEKLPETKHPTPTEPRVTPTPPPEPRPEPEPEPQPPTESNTLWRSSDSWTRGDRSYKMRETDPLDKLLFLPAVGSTPIPQVTITKSDAVCTVFGYSPRVYITMPNKDVKLSGEIFVPTGVNLIEFYLVVRSNHQDRPNGFGGYYGYFNFKEKKMYFKKEITHVQGYSRRLKEIRINDFVAGQWHKASMQVTNVPNSKNVSLRATFNNAETLAIDDGTIKCGDVVNSPQYTTEANWCFIRTNDGSGVKYRNIKLEKI